MNNTSLWEAISTRTIEYPKLDQDIETDVAIIGGGITGVTAALHLIKAGKKVVILEADKIGGVTTGYSTGNLYVPVQTFYQNIFPKFGFEKTNAIAQARKLAIDIIENNVREKNISCQFARRPWYGYTADHERISLQKEFELFKRMEIPIEYTNDLPLNLRFKKAVMIPNQARFNPLQYVISLADSLDKNYCSIYENTRVFDWEEQKDICILKTAQGIVKAKKMFMATHTPIGINHTQILTAPYRSYVVSVRVKDNDYPEGQFYDLDRPPHSTCTHAESGDKPSLLMVAGSHHKVGQGSNMQSHYDDLNAFLHEHFSVEEQSYQWSSQHYKAADNVPYIGLAHRYSKHSYMATGYFADGLIYGTIAGSLIGDLILEKNNPLAEIFNSNRFKPFAAAEFFTLEFLNVYLQYLKDLPEPETKKFDDIKPGEGKVVCVNSEKCAVSRDQNNQLHMVSAVCTHMQAIVNWNNAEQSWDCPCHGSRFTQDGKVIEGPAELNLAQKTIPIEK